MKLWKRILLTLAFLGLLLLTAWCVKRYLVYTFYSPRKIEALLEKRYNIPFTVGEQLSEDPIHAPQQDDGLPSRTWLVTADDYPELTFQVKDGWTHSYGVRGFFGNLDSYTVPEEHTLWDDCKMVSWNACVAPMLAEEYGVESPVVPEEQRYGDNRTYWDYPCRLRYDGQTSTVDIILRLSQQINAAPIFRDIGAEEEHYDDPFSQYRFRIELYMPPAPDSAGAEQEISTWLHLYPGYQYSREEIAEKVLEAAQKLQDETS